MAKEFWITNSRLKIIIIALILIWVLFLIFFYMKAEEITNDPCSVCSKRLGKEVTCTTGGSEPISRVYYTNYSYSDIIP